MDERILKWIYDIKIAINEIDIFFTIYQKDFFEYKNNIVLKRATERELEIIGEAVNRILKQDSRFENQITNAKSIIGLRNQVILHMKVFLMKTFGPYSSIIYQK